MRGFQPRNYADGGLVLGVKRMFGMDAERNARVAAYRAQAAQEKAQQQAAQAPAPAPAPAVSDYAGMGAMKRREKAAGADYADGGMVRGPGTGTSDDVPDEVPQGTYIMPADSTDALGADKLAQMGSKKVPVNLSNGEFKLPPEQVHAVGVQALDQMKAATHTPVRGFVPQAQPEEPRQFFVDGGVVKRRAAGFMPGTRAVFDESGKAIGDLASQGRYGAAAGETARAALAYGPALVDDVVGGAFRAAAPAVADAGKQFFGLGNPNAQAPQDPLAAAPIASPAPAPQAAQAPAPVPVATAQPSAATPPSAAAPAPSADIRIGGQVSAQNMAAADALAGRQSQESAARVQQAPAGFAPAGLTAPVVRNSTNDWAARKALENAATSASSITNNGGRFDRSGPGDSVAMAGFKAMLGTDQALQQAQVGLEQEGMRQNGGLQREALQQTGGLQREQVQQAGANQRAARGFEIDRQRVGLEGQRVGSEIEARGFQTRAALQQEQLRGVLTDPNATPQQRAQAQQALQAITGKGDSWKAVALQGGTDAQGNKTESILGAVNERTGEMKRMEGQGGAAMPAGMVKQVGTSNGKPVYEDANGKRFVAG